MSDDKGKPYIATGGNVSSTRLPRFVDPNTKLLQGQRPTMQVKPPIFRGQQHQRLRGRALQDLRAKMFARDPLCAHCRLQGRTRKWDELDHIKPLHKGGTDDEHNLQGLCYECHGIKTALDMASETSTSNSFEKSPGGV